MVRKGSSVRVRCWALDNAVVDDTHYSFDGVFSSIEKMTGGTIRVGEDHRAGTG
jgi:hypothetical protein